MENTIISRDMHAELDSTWNVTNSIKSLPRIPPLYVLERTRTVIDSNTSPAVIADRIAESLQELSFDAQYDGEHATALVFCPDRLLFYVRLFQSSNATEESSNSFIVEIQKKSGSAFRFHKYARLILRAAATGKKADAKALSKLRPVLLQNPEARRKEDDDASSVEKEVEHSLERVMTLLRKDRFDANLLGMESLVLLTDTQSTTFDKATCTARYIVADAKYGGLREKLKEFLWPQPAEEDFDDTFDLDQWDSMHEQVLVFLANALCLLAKENNNADHLSNWTVSDADFLQILVEETKKADMNPQNAYQALRSLNSIVESSGSMKEEVVNRGLPTSIAVAQTVGQSRHALLLQESGRMLAALGKANG